MADQVSIHMVASLVGQQNSGASGRCRRVHGRSCGGRYERVHARNCGGRNEMVHARSRGRRSAAAVKQLLSRLRRSWRRHAARPRRSAVRFGYDLHSYRQNFDDGGASSGQHRL